MTTEKVSKLIDEVINYVCELDDIKEVIYQTFDVEKAYWGRKRDNPDKMKQYDKIISSSVFKNKNGGD